MLLAIAWCGSHDDSIAAMRPNLAAKARKSELCVPAGVLETFTDSQSQRPRNLLPGLRVLTVALSQLYTLLLQMQTDMPKRQLHGNGH